MRISNTLAVTLLLVSAAAAAAAAAVAGPPVADERPVVEMHFGTRTTDPYRYFEDIKQPQVMAYLQAQAAYAESTLASLPGRQKMFERTKELSLSGGDTLVGLVERPGGALFYLRRGTADNQFKLYWRARAGEREQLLVDPEKTQAATGVPHAVNYFAPSWDGKYLAYGMSAGGSEHAQLYVLEVASGKLLGAPISRADGEGLAAVSFTPDSRAVFFTRLQELAKDAPPAEYYRNSAVYELPVGGDESAARPVFSAKLLPALGLQPGDYATFTVAAGSSWVIATVNDTTDEQYQVFALPLNELGKAGAAWRRIARVADGVRRIALHGDDLYLLTHSGAPNFRIVKLDLHHGTFAAATVVVPQQAGVVIDFTVAQDALYFTSRDAFNVAVRRTSFAGGALVPVILPVVGSASLVHDDAHQRSGVLVAAESWTSAAHIYAWDSARGKAEELKLRDPGTFNVMPDVEVTNVEVPAADGAKVPLVIIARRGLALNGKNPTILYGYGSYGFTIDPAFSPTRYAWLERGGMFAIAGVRGGGERGDDWHMAGFKASKPNTWKDGIACAEYLIAKRYTSPEFLAANGASAGGVFVGRIITARPDLFRAAIVQVGMTDTLRAEFSANGATNISEFGTVSDPAGFKGLFEMSTYQHVSDGTAYPAVLFAHGLNDPRVEIWNSLKTSTRLQKATTSGRPVLLRVEQQAGHGLGSTRLQRVAEQADIASFLLWQMGDPAFQPVHH